MSAYHLRKTEVSYELKIRSLPTDGNAGELRKRLSLALSLNTEIDEAVVDLLVPEVELDECEAKLQDLSALVADYEGDFKDNEFHRIMARLWHLYHRVNRIPVGAAASDVEESKGGLLVKSKGLLDSFENSKSKFQTEVSEEHTNVKVSPEKTLKTSPHPEQPQRLHPPLGITGPSVSMEKGRQRREDSVTVGEAELQGVKKKLVDLRDGRKHEDWLIKGGRGYEDWRLQDARRWRDERSGEEERWRHEERRLQEDKRDQEEHLIQEERKLQEELMKLQERKLCLEKNNPTTYLREEEECLGEDRRSGVQPRHVPVYKWGLKFDGQTQSIGAFLQRVEELRRARGVTPEELYDSAVDLFTGPALVWYRSTTGRINTWGSLCLEMKIVFQSPDHDIRLQQEIFSRVQGEAESIDLFIAAMEGLYGRLATRVPEEVKLKQIFHNLSPQLQDRLALYDFTSIEQLRQIGRKAEAGRYRSTVSRGSTRGNGSLEPDLAYEPNRRRTNQLASVAAPPKEIRAMCWNCGQVGHRHQTCQQARRKFCFGCGTPDVIKTNCPKCTSKCTKCTNCSKNL